MVSPAKTIVAFEFIRAGHNSETQDTIDIWFMDSKATRHDVSIKRNTNEVRVDCCLGSQVVWQPSGYVTRFYHITAEEEKVALFFIYAPRDEWNPEGIRVRIEKLNF